MYSNKYIRNGTCQHYIKKLTEKKKKKKKERKEENLEESFVHYFLFTLYTWTAGWLDPLVISFTDFLFCLSSPP
jgi:hypothetical protein